MDLKLQGSSITFAQEDVMIGGNRLALLADIDKVETIKPGQFARIPTPIAFTGDGNTIALIDMHAGRLSHALNEHEENVPAQGEYFLPPIGEETTVFVDVLNETTATLMIRPGMSIGVMTLVNLGAADEPAVQQNEPQAANAISISAVFAPEFINENYVPTQNDPLNPGVALRADIEEPFTLPAGATRSFFTGFYPEIPQGYEAQARIGNLDERVTATLGKQIADRPAVVFLSNLTGADVTVEPADIIARFVLTPVARAAFDFTTSAAQPAGTAAAR
ncbi:hypothetical protein [Erythrobacter aureus]|uniref:Uncharacterized protein n=1 Tax=Erythrobacter aureus TaxID=2182384 RepID=A0A345YIL1_9SPHN|nr:hypothetical protein [Erythrobacter aureus]AXK43763.1 hypothetical protein DVR09_15005 [Erythrobacter aureus]